MDFTNNVLIDPGAADTLVREGGLSAVETCPWQILGRGWRRRVEG